MVVLAVVVDVVTGELPTLGRLEEDRRDTADDADDDDDVVVKDAAEVGVRTAMTA